MKALSLFLISAALLGLNACTARDERMAGRAAIGAGAGAIVAGPVGAVAGAGVGAATTR